MDRLGMRSFFNKFCMVLLFIGANVVFANDKVPFPEVMPITMDEGLIKDLEENSPFIENIGFYDDSIYLKRIHHNAYYHLLAYSDSGDVVQMHDASKWEVQYSGRQKVLYWVQNDDIFIKPNISCFSSYRYVLQNRVTRETVGVNLIAPPLPMGAATFRILNIEPYARMVHLSDNTVWKVDAADVNFPYWKIGQRILIGVNNNWRTDPNPHVLINVDMYKEPHSKGNFYGYPVGY
jgi:hypothetical protein